MGGKRTADYGLDRRKARRSLVRLEPRNASAKYYCSVFLALDFTAIY
jgi:hypothetical protein